MEKTLWDYKDVFTTQPEFTDLVDNIYRIPERNITNKIFQMDIIEPPVIGVLQLY